MVEASLDGQTANGTPPSIGTESNSQSAHSLLPVNVFAAHFRHLRGL
jgi:hypothetical protein